MLGRRKYFLDDWDAGPDCPIALSGCGAVQSEHCFTICGCNQGSMAKEWRSVQRDLRGHGGTGRQVQGKLCGWEFSGMIMAFSAVQGRQQIACADNSGFVI